MSSLLGSKITLQDASILCSKKKPLCISVSSEDSREREGNTFHGDRSFWGKDTDGGRMLSVGVKSQLQKSLHRDSSWVMVWETRRAHDLGKQCSKVRDQLVQCFVESRGSTRHS